MNCRGLLLSFVLVSLAYAQGEKAEGTRQMYYLGTPQTPAAKVAASAKAPSLHLGLRYNVVLVNEKAGTTEEIPSNRVLNDGDCFAIDLQTNHAGYLYVLARQSSGSWTPLFPSPEVPGQNNQIEAFKKMQMPDGYCFAIHKPTGKETLFVVFSREKKDFFELYESVKTKHESGGTVTNDVQIAASKRMDATVEELNEKYGVSRDISIVKIREPVKKDEPRGAVYIVNTSDKLSSSLVTKIEVSHR